MKHDPEVNIFYLDRPFYNSQKRTLEVQYLKLLSGRIDFIS